MVAFGPVALVGRWLYRTVTHRDKPEVNLRAVLRRVVCYLETSGPDATVGPSDAPQAIPPVWFERGTVTALLGAVDLHLHEFGAEPAVVTVRVLFGDVTVRIPDEYRPWNVRIDARSVGGRVTDDRPGSGSEATDGGTVHLVVRGWVVFGRIRVVGRGLDDQ